MKYTYLLIDFFTIIIPVIFSFHPKLNFYKTWKAFFLSVFITGIYFIAWDIYFTHLEVWGFNARYITGIKILNLPAEEILFFFCIPYACVFTFHCLDLFIKKTFSEKTENALTLFLISAFLLTAIANHQRIYSLYTFLGLAILLGITKYGFKVKWLSKFYIIYSILLIPFLLVNGVLTGTGIDLPVVWYNDTAFIGFRVLTIPLEDIFYGMKLILMNVLIYRIILDKRHILS